MHQSGDGPFLAVESVRRQRGLELLESDQVQTRALLFAGFCATLCTLTHTVAVQARVFFQTYSKD